MMVANALINHKGSIYNGCFPVLTVKLFALASLCIAFKMPSIVAADVDTYQSFEEEYGRQDLKKDSHLRAAGVKTHGFQPTIRVVSQDSQKHECDGIDSDALFNVDETPTCILHKCQGDCDKDNDCGDGLSCFQRGWDDYDYQGLGNPPGCIGNPYNSWDYCFEKIACESKDIDKLYNVGLEPACLLQKCQGDCSKDDDCGDGLSCFKRGWDDYDYHGYSTPPGCSGNPTGSWNYCIEQIACTVKDKEKLSFVGKEPTCLLQKCQGDCDNDGDCGDGLSCFRRDVGDGGPPGCTGYPSSEWDYCFEKIACDEEGSYNLNDIAENPSCILQNCQGDCDIDDDCRDELQCFQRSDTNDIAPPGCTGNPKSNWDYCFKVACDDYGSDYLEQVDIEPACLLRECQGDCDTDDDCVDGLSCYHRTNDADLGPPGCSGDPGSRAWDYCYEKNDGGCIDKDEDHLVEVGVNPPCALHKCQGDCDSDADCKGELICFKRNGGDGDPPGCEREAQPTEQNEEFDYCIEKVAVGPSVMVEHSSYNGKSSEQIKVTFSNGPGNAYDWIGIYRASEFPAFVSFDWRYVDGTQNTWPSAGFTDGTVVFSSLGFPVGEYEVYFLENNSLIKLSDEPAVFKIWFPDRLGIAAAA